MGARQSAAMDKAKRLILERGYTQAEAARKTGITAGAISRTEWYRELRYGPKTPPARIKARR